MGKRAVQNTVSSSRVVAPAAVTPSIIPVLTGSFLISPEIAGFAQFLNELVLAQHPHGLCRRLVLSEINIRARMIGGDIAVEWLRHNSPERILRN